jgi:hypothetical protein
MALKRKCPKCDVWNDGTADYCTSCGELISPAIIEEIREQQREELRKQQPKQPVDIFLEKWEHSRFLPVRLLYKLLYGVFAIVVGIAFFFAYITVGSNG